MNLLDKGKSLMTKYPKLTSFILFIHNKFFGLNICKKKGNSNKIIGIKKSLLRHVKITINGNNNNIIFGLNTYFKNSKIYIYGNNNNIIFGNDVISFEGEFWIEDCGNIINVGNNTTIYGRTHIAVTEGKSVKIGNDCMFSTDVVIRTGDSHSIIDNHSRERINESKDIVIGDHVWFGNKTIVLKGANIESNSILGTGTVMTKPCNQNNVILAGNPAVVVKSNINWLRERI